MALSRSWAALAAAVAAGACIADAAIVDAGTLTSVTTEALVFDDRATLPSGCPPVGCVGANTRDGITSDESRWSCAPSLDSSDSGCTITYTLEDEQHLEALKIALYQGDTRTRTIDISVDGNYALSWTSSGTTSDFESIDLGVDGKVVGLVGDLQDSEWLSVLEVEILVDDGDDGSEVDVVEAGELGTVTATADLYDDRLGDTVGCDPDGCTAALTRDGDISEDSRWSCAPELGGLCSISYDLGADYSIDELQLAMYQGDTRVRTVDVAVDGDLVTTWTSSGTTSGFESVDMSGATGQVVTITGAGLSDSEWLSIVETDIMVYNGVAPPPSPTTPATPSPTLPLTTDLNACFDSTSDDYRCLPSEDDPNTVYLNNCNLVDADGADIPACLETFGKAGIQFVYMPFHDDLTTLPVGVFSGLDNILDMDISYTGLQTLPAGVFDGLSSLTKLSIHWSSLEALPEGLFEGMTSLVDLGVTSAKLSSLPAGVFTPLTALQELTLSTDVSRFPDVQLQCLPSSTATTIDLWFQPEEEILEGTCECEPAEAISCEAGTSCQPGTEGYTCG